MKIKSLFIIACAMMFTLSLSAQTRKGIQPRDQLLRQKDLHNKQLLSRYWWT